MEKPPPTRSPGERATGLEDTQAAPKDSFPELSPETTLPASRKDPPAAAPYRSISGEQREPVSVEGGLVTRATDLSRYEEGPLLGQGGMGEVVLQKDRVIGRHVARKALLAEVRSSTTIARFIREARVQGQLEHPAIVPVYDFGVDEYNMPFFTMKRVRGVTLAHVLERLAARDPDVTLRFTRHKILAAFRQVCLAVEYAHARGVVHRDLKPSNIMLGDFGEVYVLDWGLAKLKSDASVDGEIAEDRTGPDDMVGTPAYMAPEQFGSSRTGFDSRQDVFSLGAILFEILTLTRYRPGASFATLLPNLLKEADRVDGGRPSIAVPDIAPELDDACARALSAAPEARLDSAAKIGEAVERYLEGDRDKAARKALAESLLHAAKSAVEKAGNDGKVRVDAMRDAIKALALAPDDERAQKLLLSLVVDGPGDLPKEAEAEFQAAEFEVDAHGLRGGAKWIGSWFVALVFAGIVGVRDWKLVGLMIALTIVSAAYLVFLLRTRRRSLGSMTVLMVLLGATLASTSSWLGPFVLVPVATCGIAVLFGARCTPKERPYVAVIWSLAALLPFAVELLHVFPPAYTFRDNEVVLHPRILNLPEGWTLLAAAYTSVTFMLAPVLFLGWLHDKQRASDRRLFTQAWLLRQLFPAKEG